MADTLKHTPGPWRYSPIHRPPIGLGLGKVEPDANGNVFWGYSIHGKNEHGGDVLPTLGAVHNFPMQIEANARLIAAAPELLDALKEATLALDGFAKGEGVFKPIEQTIVAALAAIAKAEGRE